MDQQKKTFAVKLKGLAPWIEEIKYEREEHDLTLYFSLNKAAEVKIIVEDGQNQGKLLSPVGLPLGPLSQTLVANVEYQPNSDLYVTCVRQQDFLLCKATPLALKGAVEELKQYGGEDSSLLVLFETRGGTQGLLWSKRADMRKKVRIQSQGAEKGNWVLFGAPGSLESLRQTLKKTL